MSSNVLNQVAFLRTSRQFPEDVKQLCLELNKSYVDIANTVNSRTISLFPTNRPAQTGEMWFLLNNKRQQGLRQVYTFTSFGNILHGIDLNNTDGVIRVYGSFTDGTNWYPLPYIDSTSATNQVMVVVTPTEIQITAGAGSPPSITNGRIVLEWLSQP